MSGRVGCGAAVLELVEVVPSWQLHCGGDRGQGRWALSLEEC
jgi:hypothetical protein